MNIFIPKRNIIYERAIFHQRCQREGESVEAYVRSLYELSEHCEFDKKMDREDHIRDKLVIGLYDKELSLKLQMEKDLTLTLSVDMARHSELVKGQNKESKFVQEISSKKSSYRGRDRGRSRGRDHGHGGRGRGNYPFQNSSASTTTHRQPPRSANSRCNQCNKLHKYGQCPAHNRKCRKCEQFGHYEICCPSKIVHEITEQTYDTCLSDNYEPYEHHFIGTVE